LNHTVDGAVECLAARMSSCDIRTIGDAVDSETLVLVSATVALSTRVCDDKPVEIRSNAVSMIVNNQDLRPLGRRA
jgi:hypothetical protein